MQNIYISCPGKVAMKKAVIDSLKLYAHPDYVAANEPGLNDLIENASEGFMFPVPAAGKTFVLN